MSGFLLILLMEAQVTATFIVSKESLTPRINISIDLTATPDRPFIYQTDHIFIGLTMSWMTSRSNLEANIISP